MAGIYDEQILGAKQQAETARKLRESVTAPQGQMVSGWYVPPSITQYMAEALKTYGAGQQEKTAKSDYDKLTRQKAEETARLLKQLEPQAQASLTPEGSQLMQPFNPGNTEDVINNALSPKAPMMTNTEYVQPDEQQRMAALLRGAAVNPEAFAPQIKMAEWDMTRQDKRDQLKSAEDLKREQMTAAAELKREQWDQMSEFKREQMRRDEALRRDLANQSSQDRRFVAGLTAQGQNKAPAGYRYKPDGNLEMIPGGPADQKTQMKEAGGQTVNDVVASLRDQYSQLEAAGGITDPSKSVIENIGAGIASSGLGQMTGRLLGTKNQSLRNTIAQQRPLLLQAIMKATGMSAKQMDSNAELKLYLATATDPTLDIATNKRALDMIEKLYGSGAGNASITGNDKPASWNIDSLLEKYK